METTKEIHPQFNQEVRDRHDADTWLAEVLDGRMVTEFSYNYDPTVNELYAEDGAALGEIFEKAITDAKKMAEENPNLAFELRRREIEKSEHEDMLAMMKGGSNTMIVVSDFPPELMEATEDLGGYNATRKQTMLRVITRQDNTLKIRSLSLDGSNRESLEKIYEHFELKPEEGELLGQRVYTQLDPYQQEFLADKLAGVYDRNMSEQYGGQWRAGRRQPDNPMNTYDFVLAQTDLVDYYLARKEEPQLDSGSLKFAIAAEMERRWLESGTTSEQIQPEQISLRAGGLEEQLWLSSQQAQADGKVYSGCGATVGGADDQLKELGYGNKASKEELSWHGGRIKNGRCVNCKVVKKVGVKSWCQDCIGGHCGTK